MPTISINRLPVISWAGMADHLCIPDSGVHTWRISMGLPLQPFLQMLSVEETAEINRFHNPMNQRRYALSRGALRYLSANYMHVSPAVLIPGIDKDKKPFWQPAGKYPLQFNMAHSGEYILIAFSRQAVGVDIEKINEHFDYTGILSRCFHHDEISQLQNTTGSCALFYEYWTRKEALVKATGKGVSDNLPFIPCKDGTHEVNKALTGTAKNWMVQSFTVAEQYSGSIAYDTGIDKIIFFDFAV